MAAGVAAVLLLGGDGDGAVAYDFDGDGAQEVVIGPLWSDSSEVVIHPGTEDGRPKAISAAAAGLPDATPEADFGAGLSSADFDGDGHADLAIGAPELDVVAVLFGSDDGITGPRNETVERDASRVPFDNYGANVLARDFDDDGFGDLVVGAPGGVTEAGAIQVLHGGGSGLGRARMLEPPAGDVINFGARLRSGDVDGDGHPDLVAGSPGHAATQNDGHLAWCRGSAEGIGACELLADPDGAGGTMAIGVGDISGDGRADIVQGDSEMAGGSSGLWLWLGEEGGPSKSPVDLTAEMVGLDELAAPGSEFGATVDVGPMDADEYEDIATGAPGLEDEEGAVAIIKGGQGGYADQGHAVVRSDDVDSGGRFGSNLALLRLPGGDGKVLDLVVAANGADFSFAVSVVDGERTARPLNGLGDLVSGSAGGLRLGRTAGR